MAPSDTPRGTRALPPLSGRQLAALVRERLQQDPAWRSFTVDQRWVCPWCLSVIGRRPQRSWEDSIAAHLEVCRHYAGGSRPPLAAAVVQAQIAFENLVHRAKSDPAWQVYADGVWICPACLQRIPQVRAIGGSPSLLTYREMVQHLQRCAAYARGTLHPVAAVRAVIAPPAPPPVTPATGARSLPPPAAGGAATPLGGARVLPAAGPAVEPTAATPLGGVRIVLPPAASEPPVATPLGTRALPPLPPAPSPLPAPLAPELAWMDEADRQSARSEASAPPPPEELRRARDLQQRLLAEAPEIPGFAFATRYEPCDHVSGDFFCFVRLPHGDIGFAIGDVSGHGMQAALVMSMAKKTLEIYAAQGGGPRQVLAQVNDALASDLGGTMFVTVTYAVLSPARRTIRWVRAGHPPTLVCNHRLGTQGEIKPAGMVLGMKTGALFFDSLEEYEIDVVPGDTFLLYTDGITETTNPQGEEFGEGRLAEIFVRHASAGVESLLTQIIDRVRHFRGSRPVADDLTLLALAVP
ncbi:MAG: SpoIIE family protein phosphatase [Planctomycetes bacterium]|nr:SpoIIE family protein phosphatase [Planctomycetota bacterium]